MRQAFLWFFYLGLAAVFLFSTPGWVGASSISNGGGGYNQIQDEGSNLTKRLILNFLGAGVTCVDNTPTTDCTIPGASTSPTSPNIATIVRPVPGDFSWINQGTATLSTTGGGLNISGPGAAGTQVRLQVASTPATPWVCTMNLAVLLSAGNARAGVFLRESGTGKLLSFGGGGGAINALLVDRWNSATSYSGTAATLMSTVPMFANGFWVQAAFDGSDIFFRLSPDGVNFVQYYTEAATAFFTVGPDQCGIGFDSEGTGNPSQSNTLLSYAN